LKLFSTFLKDTRGNLALASGILAIPMILAAGTAVDLANANRVSSDLQSALDAATMAIAVKVPSGMTDLELQALGNEHFNAHLQAADVPAGALSTLQYVGLSNDAQGVQHIMAKVNYTHQLALSHLFRDKQVDGLTGIPFELLSRVSVRIGDTACIYALNRTASRAINAGGSTTVVMDGCVLAANSAAADAIYVGGNASVAADCLQSSGGIDATGGLVTDCAAMRENAWPLPDPFAGFPHPAPPILMSNPKNSDLTVQPGRYRNLSLDGTKTLEPGLYYIEGSLSVKGDISGTGVTFYMADGGVTVNGHAAMALSAPQSGDYAGMLFMAPETNTSAHKFNGTGATELNGYLYFPKGDLSYSGSNSTSSTCLRIVADTVTMTGNSYLKSDCTAELGGREARVSGPLHFTM
jgi:Flp pilus assembly protein TadG